MPNGYEHERDAVWGRSRLWGTVWQAGDLLYYAALLCAVTVPMVALYYTATHFETWGKALRVAGAAVASVVVGTPAGMSASAALKWLARRQTGEG